MSDCKYGFRHWIFEKYRVWSVTLRGVSVDDQTNLAEMGISGSLAELRSIECRTKQELGELVTQVKTMNPKRHRAEMFELVRRSRLLRSKLDNTTKKKIGMEHHLETLKQSQLNQSMITSMKQTNEALQTLGLNVTKADDIMCDLEDTTGDLKGLQNSLCQNFSDYDLNQEDLENELEMMLSDDTVNISMYMPSANSKHSAEAEKIIPQTNSTLCNEDDNNDLPPSAGMVEVQNIRSKPLPNKRQSVASVREEGEIYEHVVTQVISPEPAAVQSVVN